MSARVERLAALAAEEGLDALLVTDLANVRWATGFTGSSGLALVGPGLRTFVTDFRYVEQAAAEVAGLDRRRAPRELLEAVPAALGRERGRLGFDDANLSVRGRARLGGLLPAGVELVEAGGLVERLRAVKDEAEIAAIGAASELADDALREVLEAGLAGRAERAVALALEVAMRERGAEAASFEPIVAAGPHGALPHAVPRDVAIPRDALVVIDWGARLDGYCSDCTRTFATGAPGAEAEEAYALVLAAQRAGVEAARPDREGREVDAAARAVIEEAGRGEQFGHGLGHGVGLEVHEAPRLGRTSSDVLAARMVVTVEPGVYVPGAFGIRIEDLVAVRPGAPEVLSGLDRQLTVV